MYEQKIYKFYKKYILLFNTARLEVKWGNVILDSPKEDYKNGLFVHMDTELKAPKADMIFFKS